jgi:hypothetical protein
METSDRMFCLHFAMTTPLSFISFIRVDRTKDNTLPNARHRTVFQVAELKEADGELKVDQAGTLVIGTGDRDSPTYVHLQPSK